MIIRQFTIGAAKKYVVSLIAMANLEMCVLISSRPSLSLSVSLVFLRSSHFWSIDVLRINRSNGQVIYLVCAQDWFNRLGRLFFFPVRKLTQPGFPCGIPPHAADRICLFRSPYSSSSCLFGAFAFAIKAMLEASMISRLHTQACSGSCIGNDAARKASNNTKRTGKWEW